MGKTHEKERNTEFPRILQFLPTVHRRIQQIAKQLYGLMEKDKKWEFGKQQQEAFEDLIYKLTHAPILAHYDPKKPEIIKTDASKYVNTGIISQPGDNNMLRPVAFRSTSMSKSECNYDVHDKELLAIILALEDWRRYV